MRPSRLALYRDPRLIASIVAPLKLQSRANQRWNWCKTHRVNKGEKEVTAYVFRTLPLDVRAELVATIGRASFTSDRLFVLFTRCGPRALDSDNVQGSAKAVRDAIAACLGVDDADPRVDWDVAQHNGRGVRYETKVEFYRVVMP